MLSKHTNSLELQRLSTFTDYRLNGRNSFNVESPLILARHGFQYAGRDDVVICCNCQAQVRGWATIDDVRRKHSSCLRQFYVYSDEIASIINSVRKHLPHGRRTDGSSSLASVDSNRDVKDSRTPDATTSTTVKANSPFYDVCDTVICRASRKNFSDIYNNAATPAVSADIAVDRTRPNFEHLAAESARLATFHDWSDKAASTLDPRELAKAGLFYTGQADRVQCAFCRGYIHSFEQGVTPADKHRRHFPGCPFVQNVTTGIDVVDRTVSNQVLIFASVYLQFRVNNGSQAVTHDPLTHTKNDP